MRHTNTASLSLVLLCCSACEEAPAQWCRPAEHVDYDRDTCGETTGGPIVGVWQFGDSCVPDTRVADYTLTITGCSETVTPTITAVRQGEITFRADGTYEHSSYVVLDEWTQIPVACHTKPCDEYITEPPEFDWCTAAGPSCACYRRVNPPYDDPAELKIGLFGTYRSEAGSVRLFPGDGTPDAELRHGRTGERLELGDDLLTRCEIERL
jgi:hypothetical protein